MNVLEFIIAFKKPTKENPPNSTGILQPLDLSEMVCKAWLEAATPENIRSGWRAAGMGIIDNSMGTSKIPSDSFNYKLMGTEKAPADLVHILKTSAEERKAKPRRSNKITDVIGYGQRRRKRRYLIPRMLLRLHLLRLQR